MRRLKNCRESCTRRPLDCSLRFISSSTAQRQFEDINQSIADIDSDISTASGQLTTLNGKKDKLSQENEAILRDTNKLKADCSALSQRERFLAAILESNLHLISSLGFVGKCEHDPTVVLIEKLNVTQSDLIAKLTEYKQKLTQVGGL